MNDGTPSWYNVPDTTLDVKGVYYHFTSMYCHFIEYEFGGHTFIAMCFQHCKNVSMFSTLHKSHH